MKNFIFIILLICTIFSYGKNQPNIVLLFVDDLGWADLGYRNTVFRTPNIDKLKDEGLDFSRAYVSTATCSPSRASILTGKEPVRMQMVRHITFEDEKLGRNDSKFNFWPTDPAQMPSVNWLPKEEITYAERLKEFGYYNMFIGKWHLGHEEFHPIHQGFDNQYGTSNYGHPKSYYQPFFKYGNPLKEISNDEYLTDVLTNKAVDIINTYDKKQPFMVSMWYYNAHGPHIEKKELLAKYQKAGLQGRYAKYAAMVEAMDESVGRVIEALKYNGMEENTMVIFTSDQGGYFTNAPLRGGKTGGNSIGEGGSRIPLIIKYPQIIKSPSVCEIPIQTIDIYPTLVEIASGKKCEDSHIQGVSLLPLLQNKSIQERNLYFYRSYEDQYAGVISGDWKLIKYRSGKFELFNLTKDIGEVSNLIFMELATAEKLKNELLEWEMEAVPKY